MDFKQVIKACLDFSTANNGTIQSYPAGHNNQLDIQSRNNTRTSIHIEQLEAPGAWAMEQRQNAVGGGKKETNNKSETVTTEERLLEYLSRFWDRDDTTSFNTHKACIRLGHVIDFVCREKPVNEVLNWIDTLHEKPVISGVLNLKFECTLVTGPEETPETHKELVVMPGIDTLHMRLKECACTKDWSGMLHCGVCPTTGLNIHTANVRGGYGHGSDTIQEPGDIMMSVDYNFALVTALGETPDTHKELVMRVIDELFQSLKECACDKQGGDFWKQA